MPQEFNFDIPAWTANDLLTAWQQKYGHLDENSRERFVNHFSVVTILKYHPGVIRRAIGLENRLIRISGRCAIHIEWRNWRNSEYPVDTFRLLKSYEEFHLLSNGPGFDSN